MPDGRTLRNECYKPNKKPQKVANQAAIIGNPRSPRSFQNEWFDNLSDDSDDEEESLNMYGKLTHHRGFNGRLRDHTETTEDIDHVTNLDRALELSPKGEVATVYRGIVLNDDELDEVTRNMCVFNAGYSSTTTSESMVNMFSNGSDDNAVVLVFETDKKGYLDLGEREILLPRGLVLNVDSIDEEDERTVLFCHQSPTKHVPDRVLADSMAAIVDGNIDFGSLANSEDAEGMCWRVSEAIEYALGDENDVETIGMMDDSGTNHFATVLNGETVIDYTMRQFYPDEDFPLVCTIDEWKDLMSDVSENNGAENIYWEVNAIDNIDEPEWYED